MTETPVAAFLERTGRARKIRRSVFCWNATNDTEAISLNTAPRNSEYQRGSESPSFPERGAFEDPRMQRGGKVTTLTEHDMTSTAVVAIDRATEPPPSATNTDIVSSTYQLGPPCFCVADAGSR